MLFADVSPFVRFAEIVHYASPGVPARVRDCRVFYVLSGEADLSIGSQVYSLAPDSVFYCNAGNAYSISSAGMDFISINFDLFYNGKNRERPYSPVPLSAGGIWQPINDCCVEDQSLLNDHLFLPDAVSLRESFDAVLTEFSTRRLLYRESAGALLKNLLVRLLRSNASQGVKVPEKIIDYIRMHYNESLPNTLFSQMFGYHEYYLNRLFQKHTGRTIRQYILDMRISNAKKTLLNTDDPLSVIAEKVGFNSYSYFSTYFRQVTGLSPAQFRKKYKNVI